MRVTAQAQVRRRHLLRISEMTQEVLRRHFDVPQNRSDQSAPQIFATMHWNDGCPAIRMQKIRMTPFLSQQLKTQTAEKAGHLGGGDDRELAQALNST